MADPTTDVPPAIDEFAQTRGGDDLFDDEIIPVSTEEQPQPEIRPEIQSPQEESVVAKPDNDGPPASTPTRPRSRGGERGRGRGRGRGRSGRGGRNSSGQRRAEGGGGHKPVENVPETESGGVEESTQEKSEKGTESPEKEDDAASASNGTEGQRVPAVRGDRSATGGIKKPKLTEEQLSQRIAAAKENAAKLSAAHARAEADQASFLEREKVAEVKRRQERESRRVMDSERERNRQRKLGALNGREWDATKHEEDYNPRGGKSQFRRGMHGGVSGHVRRDFEDNRQGEDAHGHQNNYRGRGRGGRGGRGRTNSRGPRRDGAPDGPSMKETNAPPPVPVVNNESDFPALPSGPKDIKDTPAGSKPAPAAEKTTDSAFSPVAAGASWAEQVEEQ